MEECNIARNKYVVTIYWPKDRIICNRNGHVKSEVMNSDDQKAQVLNPNAVTAAA